MGSGGQDDLQRVRDAMARDPAAMAWLTERLQRVPRVIASLGRRFAWIRSEDLQDISSEVVATVLERLDHFHGRSPFDAWVGEFCKNTVLGYCRRARRRSLPSLEFDPAADELDPSESIVKREDASRIRATIDRIGGVEAEVLRWRLLEGEDFGDISDREGIPIATLRTRYYRGVKRLKDMLSDDESGESPP